MTRMHSETRLFVTCSTSMESKGQSSHCTCCQWHCRHWSWCMCSWGSCDQEPETCVLWLCSLRWLRMMPAFAQEGGFIKWFIFYTLEFSQPFLVIPASHHCPANCWLSKSENSILLREAASRKGLKETTEIVKLENKVMAFSNNKINSSV